MSTPDADAVKTLIAHGLSSAEVAESRRRYGANVLTPPERDPWWKLYLEKFKDPIIRILCVAAVVAIVVGLYDGHYIEGIGIVVAILLSTGLSFFNEYRAAREFDILNQVSDGEEIPVVRDGRHLTVPKRDLVVGDIVLTEQGAEIPADAKVLKAISLAVNESSLTGESMPVTKRPVDPDAAAETGLAYPRDAVLRGTTVSDGHGVILVTAVGDATEIGKTARAAAEDSGVLTPLAKQLEKLAGVISIGAFAAAAVIFVAQTIRGAVGGEIYDLMEQSGSMVRVPLDAGQWYCFILLAVAMAALCSRIWSPVLKDGLELVGRPDLYPRWLDTCRGRKGFLKLLAAAAIILVGGIVIGVLLGALHLRYGDWFPLPALGAFLRYFMVAVTVIVVAVPEGLPMCVTLALAYSMRKMTATNNLVRHMHACETIGAASVICSDKTGTLTMNEMRVNTPIFPFLDGETLPPSGTQPDRLAEAIAANSTAHLSIEDGRATSMGNPTEGALLLWLHHSGRDYQEIRYAFRVKQQLTFSTERKFMATAGFSGLDGKPVLYVKGAAEIVLARCASVRNADGTDTPLDAAARDRILAEAAEYQNRGMRIIGIATEPVAAAFLERGIDADAMDGLIWEGCIAIADPIRPDVGAAIDAALEAGIKVKVVTGDNRATAREIARQAGLWKEGDTDANWVKGEVFEAMDDEEAAETAERIKVMSRARPLHKLRLVKLLQSRGEVVAVTGDGTNDAPALNHADVGLAMGKTGTAVAKEAADIILLDDSFTSIVNAVSWGRSLYANIQKFVVFQLTINVAAVGIALLGPFLGITLPLTVVQMLWVNLIMDTFAALALASEPPDWSLMKNPPRSQDAFIITKPMKDFILGVGGAFLGVFALVMLILPRVVPMTAETAEGRHNLTIFFTAFVGLQFWNLFNARVFGSLRSAFSGLRQSRGFVAMAIVIAIGQYLLVQYGGAMFRVTPLSVGEWIGILVLTSPVALIGEFWRMHRRMSSSPDYWVYSS